MAYQYVREPLTPEIADKLCQACETTQEKLILWTLLDTGLRVSELCDLVPQKIMWQQKSLRIDGKGGIHGKKTCGAHVEACANFVGTLLRHS